MIRPSGLSVLVLGLVAAAVGPAVAAAKPHCRDLTFSGSAGPLSSDKITLQLTDSAGVPIEQSCKLQVNPNESGRSFAARLVALWGDGSGVTCPDPNNPPDPLPRSSCGSHPVQAKSCKHRFKFKPDRQTVDPDDGLVRIRICCKDDSGCRGPNAVTTPVSVQSKKDPAVVFAPSVPPPVGVQIVGVAIDPIDMTQLPGGEQVGCRKDLAAAVAELARRTLDAFLRQIPPDPILEAKLRDTAQKCGVDGSLAGSLGYGVCPAPCEGVLVNVCLTGTTGAPCNTHTDCDTPPGSGNGQCSEGTWNQVADCLVCQVTTAMTAVAEAAYGSGPDPTPEAEHCQDTIGKAVLDLVRAELNETLRCQKIVDAGRTALPADPPRCAGGGPCTTPPCLCTAPPLAANPPRTCNDDPDCAIPPTCKRADLVGARARAAQRLAEHVTADCTDMVIADELDTCGTDQPSLVACLTDVGQHGARKIADAAFPEGGASP